MTDPAHRSQVIATIDFDDSVDAAVIAKTLRANGVVDTEPLPQAWPQPAAHRDVPAIDPDDVSALLASIDWIVEQI